MTDITINQTRGGTLSAPFVALTVETLTFSGTAPEDGTTVALLSPSGDTIASTHVAGGQATLNLNTIQADAATRYTEVGTTIPVVLAIGDTDHLQALIQTTLQRNPLDNIAPPTVSAPIYPTNAELKAVLARINAVLQAANQTAEAVSQDAQRVDNLVNVELQKAVEEIDSHLDERVRSAEKTIERAATDASEKLSDAAESASTALDNKLTTAQTAIDGKVTAANNAAAAADGSAQAADKSRQDAEAAKGDAAESAKNAATSAEQAEQAKEAIGDVGERLEAVETSVADKVPYLSDDFNNRFNVSPQYNIADNGQKILNPCHKGWVCAAVYNRTYKNFDYYIAPDGTVTKTTVAIFKDGGVGYKAHLIYADKTVIFSENYNNEKIKCTIDDGGVRCDKVDAFPANVASYNEVFGIINSHGFIVTTGGVILEGDTLEEVATFYAINTATAVISKRGDHLLGKNDDDYYYFDQGQKHWCQLVTDENGTPTIEVNTSYKQNTGFKFAPLGSKHMFLATDAGYFRGISASGLGYIYDTRRRLETPTVSFFRSKKRRDVVIFTWNEIAFAMQKTLGDSHSVKIGENVFFKWYRDRKVDTTIVHSYSRFASACDYSGNIIIAMFSVFHWGSNQPFHILTEK